MKAKNHIFKILLIAFVFLTVHDFTIEYIDSDTQAELCTYKVEKVPLCEASIFHELIHQALMMTPPDLKGELFFYDLKVWVRNRRISFPSSVEKNSLYRPPIV